MDRRYHVPALVESVLRFLPANPDGIYVDGTLGGGGHAEAIVNRLSPHGTLVGFDADDEAVDAARTRLAPYASRTIILHENAANLKSALDALKIDGIDGLLMDLGVSSHQIDDPGRGFSFQADGRLDMRMDRRRELDAWTVVNRYDEARLSRLFLTRGEEHHSRRIASAIVKARAHRPIDTTASLASVIASAVGRRMLSKTLARIFQAVRIEVNDELENLQRILDAGISLLRARGRIVVVSYHSLEDRIVKQTFQREARQWISSGSRLLPDRPREPRLQILTRKPLTPEAAERAANPRARSAKLRAAEKL